MQDTIITVIGNLTADPELRFTPSGAAVANFTVASTPRKFNKKSNQWEDEETLFMRCSVWRDAAENVAESLQKGMRVIVSGKLKMRSYETKEGEKRSVTEMDVEEIGASLRSATVKVNRPQRGQQAQQEGWGQQPQQADDPWARPAQPRQGQQQQGQQQQGGWGQQSYDEPPF